MRHVTKKGCRKKSPESIEKQKKTLAEKNSCRKKSGCRLMRRILAIDPGITTGIAVYDENGELVISLTCSKDALYRNGILNNLVSMSQPEVVLLEDIPTQHADRQTERLHTVLENWFRTAGFNVVNIKPSQWKGLVERVEIPGQHARDAASMARWFIEKERAKENE
jgi:hypothetical protein